MAASVAGASAREGVAVVVRAEAALVVEEKAVVALGLVPQEANAGLVAEKLAAGPAELQEVEAMGLALKVGEGLEVVGRAAVAEEAVAKVEGALVGRGLEMEMAPRVAFQGQPVVPEVVLPVEATTETAAAEAVE